MIIDGIYKHIDNFLDVGSCDAGYDRMLLRVGAFQSLRADFATYIRHGRYLRDKHAGSASEPVILLT